MNKNKISFFSRFWYPTHLVLLFVLAFGVLYLNYLIFMVVPNEKQMGAVQRIFYFHVPSAIACYCSMLVVFLASIFYLKTKSKLLDHVNQAASEVALLFCTITLVSGMIWAKSSWNTWFKWEPRLVTFLMLWTIIVGVVVVRRFGNEELKATHCSILGILGALTIPLVWLSVKLIKQAEVQLHPTDVVSRGGLRDPRYTLCFLTGMLVMFIFQGYLIYFRTIVSRIGSLIKEEN